MKSSKNVAIRFQWMSVAGSIALSMGAAWAASEGGFGGQPVKVDGGMVSGAPGRNASITAFKGIPFGAPPVGALRWKEPQPVVAWDGVRKATEFSASCVQNIVHVRKPWTQEFMAHNEVSEDCLYLNVWTPAKSARDKKRPVFVYIYGGGFNEGSTQVPVYDGEGLAQKGLVVVTVNYRLGVLGFLSHPELGKESPGGKGASGNWAILDQIAALKWIQANIGAFGGDASRVTIAGQSAGAASVHALVASPLAKGLFHRAIAQSGSSVAAAGSIQARTLADQEALGVKFAEAKGAKSLAELRAMAAKDIVTPVQGANFRFGLVVDGYVLQASVADTIAQGKHNDVPTLTGVNKDEYGASPKPEIAAAAFEKQVRDRFGAKADEFFKLYPVGAGGESLASAVNDSARDQARTSMMMWAERRAKTSKTRTFTYFWDHALPGPEVEKYGAFHSSEVPYVLNTLGQSDRPFTPADHKVAAMMSSYWANFATNGDPNGKGLAQWPSVEQKPGFTMEVGDVNKAIPVAGSEAKLGFFREYFDKSR